MTEPTMQAPQVHVDVPSIGEERAFGWRMSPPDPRDFRFAASSEVLSAVKPKVDLTDELGPVKNQHSIGSCTCNAGADAIEHAERKLGQSSIELSRLELYYRIRALYGEQNVDGGAYIRDVPKVASHLGVANEKLWPYDVGKWNVEPPATLKRSDRYHRVLEYRSVTRNEMDMRACLSEGYGFIFGFPVFSSFTSIGADGQWAPSTSEGIIGYHAVFAAGYDYEHSLPLWKIRNSWGEAFGAKGYFYVTTGFMLANAFDIWTIRRST